MSDPIVTAVAVRRGRECWVVEIICPHCGQRHQHGGNDGLIAQGGHRVAHCQHLRGRGYFIALDASKSEEARHG